MSALVDLRAYFWKVPITFRTRNQIFKSNPQRILKKGGPSEPTSPVCLVTDKQIKTIEISVELSLECFRTLRLSRNGPLRCEYQTTEICLRRLLSQKRLCSMSMNQDTLISKTQNLGGMPMECLPLVFLS